MQITFVRPNMSDMRSSDAMEPLVFAILAALTPPQVETVLFDEFVESIPFDHSTDLVALTVNTYTARQVKAHILLSWRERYKRITKFCLIEKKSCF